MQTANTQPPASADVLIIGAGIVGLACAWAAQRAGLRVTLLDRDFAGDRTSHGNAGGIAVSESTPASAPGIAWKALRWMADPLGPLAVRWQYAPHLLPWLMAFNRVARPDAFARISAALGALNRRVYEDLLPLLDDIGLSSQLYRRGALTVYETAAGWHADAAEWQIKRAQGVRWREVTTAELRQLEPALAPAFVRAVMLEDWSHVGDPQRLVHTLREYLHAQGAILITGTAAALLPAASGGIDVRLTSGPGLHADQVVVAAGAWSKALAASAGDPVLLESERGYNTTLPRAAASLQREVIFAERKFVATPLDIGLRIGGAAEFAGLDAAPNYRRSDALLKLGRRFINGLDEGDAVQWMGQRPTTPDSLPVIGPSPRLRGLIYAFGHGHLGLTHAATTGALVAELLAGRPATTPLQPYSIERFAGQRG